MSGPVPIRPLTPDAVLDELAAAVAGRGGRVRVLVDGAPATDPGGWADGLVERLRVLGRPVLRVRAEDFLRPASLRLERGRRDADAYYDDRLDVGALVREVLAPAGPDGSGQVLPALWDARIDRAHRVARVEVPERGVVLLDGSLLLGHGLPADLTVHLALSAPALARRTPEDEAWTLPAFARYGTEVDPAGVADLVVLVDHPGRPALRS